MIKEIVKKWYRTLSFPQKYDDAFAKLVEETDVPQEAQIESYQFSQDLKDGGKNLIMCLYFCQELENRYAKQGIDDKILYDTLSDLVYWTGIHDSLTGELGLSEVNWVKNHLSGKLFRLGRLQYCFGECGGDIDALGIKKGEKIIEVHIPAGESLELSACEASVEQARAFYKTYFPQENYRCFTCSSWLLDDTLIHFMKETSNIIKFQRMFTLVSKKESFAILKYSLGWNARKENLHEFAPVNGFTERVIKHVEAGGVFYAGFGYIEK